MQDQENLRTCFEICDAKLRYCQLLDAKDWVGYQDLFTENFQLDVSEKFDSLSVGGRGAAISQIRSRINTAITFHRPVSVKIGSNGDKADAIFAMQVRMIFGPRGQIMSISGDFCEHWVRQRGEWKIARLKLMRCSADRQPVGHASTTLQ